MNTAILDAFKKALDNSTSTGSLVESVRVGHGIASRNMARIQEQRRQRRLAAKEQARQDALFYSRLIEVLEG